MIGVLTIALQFVVLVLVIYTARHYFFTLNRLYGRHRQPYVDVTTADWPQLYVFVPAHNEGAVIGDSLEALLASDYPSDRFVIVPIDDRSQDNTRAIINQYAERYPGRIVPHLRDGGTPGKSAVMQEVSARFDGDVHLTFDADYIPGPRLLRHLAAPFFDPEVGAVMGRVVPLNVGRSLLTRLLDLERAGGYQVDQQARMNLRLVPQYGGTVGGVRRTALREVGGWHSGSLAEDTEMTFRLVTKGWDVVYQNRSECYEEVPETWAVRVRQIQRWAKGHNQAMLSYVGAMLRNRAQLPARQVIDGVLLLGVFVVPLLLIAGWILTLALFYLGAPPSWGPLAVLAVSSFSTVGNFAAFFQVAAASRLDGSHERIRMLPFLLLGFLVSTLSVARATLSRSSWMKGRGVSWDKTERWRGRSGAEAYASGVADFATTAMSASRQAAARHASGAPSRAPVAMPAPMQSTRHSSTFDRPR